MSLELLSLGLDAMGGIFGMSGANRDRRLNAQMQQAQLKQAQEQFNAQMDQSVTRRVQDAKNAGVHPLFALGASVGSSPTISSVSTPDNRGSGNAMQSALTAMASTLGVIEQNRASARRDEAEAALLDSERKRLEQELVQRGNSRVNTYPYGAQGEANLNLGPVEFVKPQIEYSRPDNASRTAGVHPGLNQLDIGDGVTVTLFADKAQADEINQLILGGGLMHKGVNRTLAFYGWTKGADGVWRKTKKREPYIRIKKEDGTPVWEW